MSSATIDTEASQKHRRAFSRVAAVGGVVWIILTVLSIVFVGEMPTSGDDADAIRDYLTRDSGSHQAGVLAITLSLVPLLLFAAGLVATLRRSSRLGDDGWSSATGAFYVFAASVGSISMLIDAGLGLSRDVDVDDGTLLALWDISMAATALMVLGFAAAVACASISSLANHTWPKWHGWLGVVVGIAGLFALVGMVSDSDIGAASGFLVLPLFVIWTIITSVFMYRDA